MILSPILPMEMSIPFLTAIQKPWNWLFSKLMSVLTDASWRSTWVRVSVFWTRDTSSLLRCMETWPLRRSCREYIEWFCLDLSMILTRASKEGPPEGS